MTTNESRDELIASVEGLVVYVAKKRFRPGFEFGDLVQAGRIAAIEAAIEYDASLQEPFGRFAAKKIGNAICKFVRQNDAVVHVPHAARVRPGVVSVTNMLGGEGGDYEPECHRPIMQDGTCNRSDSRRLLARLIDENLPKQMKRIVCMILSGKTNDDAAAFYHVSRERIAELYADAIHRLKKAASREGWSEEMFDLC